MPATNNAERRTKFIDKLKLNGNYDAYKKKKAEHEKSRRQRIKHSLTKLTETKRKQVVIESRLKCRKRVEKCREKKKQVASHQRIDSSEGMVPNSSLSATSTSQIPQRSNCKSIRFANSYRTEGALSKAVNKIRKTLPKSPTKRQCAIGKLFYSLDDKAQDEIYFNRTKLNKGGKKGIDPTLITKIHEFYERDDISRMSPNVKDAKYFKNPSTSQKEIRQIRHMVLTLESAYNIFTDENAGNPQTVKSSKFCALRPPHVKLMHSMPHNVCVCIYHANFIEVCTVLHKNLPGFPKVGKDLTSLLVCDKLNKDCCFKTCANCHSNKIEQKLRQMAEKATMKSVTWLQWEKDDTTNRVQKHPKTGTIKTLMNYFIGNYKDFLKHSYTQQEQAKNFNLDRKSVASKKNLKECLLQADWAENFTCESQDEVQPAHWNQAQISLFTVALQCFGKVHPKVIVSDHGDHFKETIGAYLYTILLQIPKTIKTVRLWTDGPVSQFKNKFMAALIKLLEEKLSIKIIWNYFATAHGKGCIDGIGAVAKKKVKRLVRTRKAIVNCTKDFVTTFNKEKSKVQLIEMTKADIDKINDNLGILDVFKNAPAIKDISQFHQLQSINNKIKGFLTSTEGYNFSNKIQ